MLLQRTIRAVLSLGLALALLTTTVAVTARPATASTVGDEQAFVQLINQVRAEKGLTPLEVHGELTVEARAWAAKMSADDVLAHSPNMAKGISASWTVLGENVGVHGVDDLQQLFQAFVASPSHYQNLIDPRFQYLGVGVVHSGSGKLWTTHRFMATESSTATTAAPPTTAPPTTASPTTKPPTTKAPTTKPPATTPKPTTAPPPSTSKPTTTGPATTTKPTTVKPIATTTKPTTAKPTTADPTTDAPKVPSTVSGSPTSTTVAGEGPPSDQAKSPDSTASEPTEPKKDPITPAEVAKLVQPDASTIEEVLIELVEAGI